MSTPSLAALLVLLASAASAELIAPCPQAEKYKTRDLIRAALSKDQPLAIAVAQKGLALEGERWMLYRNGGSMSVGQNQTGPFNEALGVYCREAQRAAEAAARASRAAGQAKPEAAPAPVAAAPAAAPPPSATRSRLAGVTERVGSFMDEMKERLTPPAAQQAELTPEQRQRECALACGQVANCNESAIDYKRDGDGTTGHCRMNAAAIRTYSCRCGG